MPIGSSPARNRRAATALLAAASLTAALALSGCTSTPVAEPSAPLTLQTDASVQALPSTTPSKAGSSSPSPSKGQAGSSDAPPGSPPSTVSSTVTTTPGSSPRPTTTSTPTSSRSVDPTTPKPPTASPQPPTRKPPVTLTDGPISPQETADRAAVEKAWVKYWGVFTNMMKVPPDQRREVYGSVAVDPQLTNMINDAAFADKKKIDNYGTVVHRFNWPVPISVTGDPILGDCMDQSKFGIFDVEKSRALSHGSARVNLQATLTRSDGAWKVVGYIQKTGTSC